MDICSQCNYFDAHYGCLHDDRQVDCPLYYENYPNYEQEIDFNIRAFEKTVSDKNKNGGK